MGPESITLLHEVGRGFSPVACSCPRPVVTRARVCTKGKSRGNYQRKSNSGDRPEPRSSGKLGVRMQVEPRSTKEARSLQISLLVLQLDTWATVIRWRFLSCPTHHTTGWRRKEGERHWFSHLCDLPLVHQEHASGKQAPPSIYETA